MKKRILTAWAALLPGLVSAEEIQNPMSLGLAGLVQTFNGNALEAAEAMRNRNTAFAPLPKLARSARSFPTWPTETARSVPQRRGKLSPSTRAPSGKPARKA